MITKAVIAGLLILLFAWSFPAGGQVINEINLDPALDANGDGFIHMADDEFIEIVNESFSALDISGWTLSDAGLVRHVFPVGTVLDARSAIVIFGGGTPVDLFGGAQIQTATTGGLSLNNTGDTVTLSDGVVTIASLTYTGTVVDESLVRYPEISGSEPLVAHSGVSPYGDTISPGVMLSGDGFPGSPYAPALVINEILYDGSVDGDPNNDGNLDSIEDEFIEIVNQSGGAFDISGWTLSDADMVRHVFPAGSVISSHCNLVVFGGGSPEGSFGGAVVQVASVNPMFGLSLNNSGDAVILTNGVIDVLTYTYIGTVDGVSVTRYPDITGLEPLLAHDIVPGSSGDFSPGLMLTGSNFPGCSLPVWFRDADLDGYGDPEDSVSSETQPAGYVSDDTDCDDTRDTVYPGAPEICGDLLDNDCNGTPDDGCTSLAIIGITDVGNDQGRLARVRWSADILDTPASVDPIVSYSLYRRIDGNKTLDTSDWDFVVNLPAATQSAYSALAPTLCDSTGESGICWSVFAVRAHTTAPGTFFDSDPDSGYSVDNLSPTAPVNLLMAGTDLNWDEAAEADFDYFTIYGSSLPFLDGTAELVGYTTDTSFDVSTMPHGHYHLTATDFNGNEGPAASTMGVSAVDGTVPSMWRLGSNVPNPFNPTTRISFDVPDARRVTLVIYDISGRLVRTLVAGELLQAKSHSREWNGTDDSGQNVAAGVYFYRMDAGGFIETKRMTLLK